MCYIQIAECSVCVVLLKTTDAYIIYDLSEMTKIIQSEMKKSHRKQKHFSHFISA